LRIERLYSVLVLGSAGLASPACGGGSGTGDGSDELKKMSVGSGGSSALAQPDGGAGREGEPTPAGGSAATGFDAGTPPDAAAAIDPKAGDAAASPDAPTELGGCECCWAVGCYYEDACCAGFFIPSGSCDR
jgi:hypothetical protein